MHSFCKEVEYVKVTPSRGPSNQTLNNSGCGVDEDCGVIGVVIAVTVGVVEGVVAVEDAVVVIDDGLITLMRTQPTLSYSRTLSPPSAPP